MNVIVFVPCTLLPTPCANLPNSFAAEICHAAHVSRLVMSCWYSINFPVVGCATALARKLAVMCFAWALCVRIAISWSVSFCILGSSGTLGGPGFVGTAGFCASSESSQCMKDWSCWSVDVVGCKSCWRFFGGVCCLSAFWSALAAMMVASCVVMVGIGSFRIGGVDVASMASVVFHHWADVPSLLSMWIPACPLSWLFVDNNFCTRWHEWVLIVVVSAKHYFMG
jgi:hypothetical protein